MELQTIEHAAKRLNVTRNRVYAMIASGVLPPGVVVHLGRRFRINPEKLEQYIEAGGKRLDGGWRREPTEARD